MKLFCLIFVLGVLTACSKEGASDQEPIMSTDKVEELPSKIKPVEASDIAHCAIEYADLRYEGLCKFILQEKGTFFVAHVEDYNRPLIGSFRAVTVLVTSKGKARVFATPVNKPNQRWGLAERSIDDLACWLGATFKVCAYALHEKDR